MEAIRKATLWRGTVGALMAGLLSASGCGRAIQPAAVTVGDSVRIGIPLQLASGLMILAWDRGLLERAGIAPMVTEFPSGQRALVALLAGELDVTTSGDVPVVMESFRRQDFCIPATISTTGDEPRIVARRDRGIVQASDLNGKRIGTQRGAAVHYFLSMFQLKHAVTAQPVFLKAELAPLALAEGEVDAIATREPFVTRAVQALGDNAVVFEANGLYFRIEALVTGQEFARQRPETVQRVLRALLLAEQFAREQPETAAGVVAQRLRLRSERVAKLWGLYDFRVTLEQALLSNFENEARWVLANGLVSNREMPNYLHVVCPAALAAVKPAAVTIIR